MANLLIPGLILFTVEFYRIVRGATNANSVYEWLQDMADRSKVQDLVLVLDNHPAHKSWMVREFCEHHFVYLMWLP